MQRLIGLTRYVLCLFTLIFVYPPAQFCFNCASGLEPGGTSLIHPPNRIHYLSRKTNFLAVHASMIILDLPIANPRLAS